MRRILILLLCCFLTINVSADKIHFEHIDTNDGLSYASVNSIAKDSLGFMWFALGNGIDRYSGSDFKHYDLSLSTDQKNNKNVLSIENVDGKLWATLRSGHLFCYNYLSDKFELKASDSRHYFRNLCKISEAELLISGTVIHRYSIENQQLKTVYKDEDNYFRTLRYFDNRIYAATDKGVYVFFAEGDSLVLDRVFLADSYIQTLEIFKNNLVVGTSEKGLYLINLHGDILKHRSFGYGENIQSLACDSSAIYIGVNRVGLISLDSNFENIQIHSHDIDLPFSLSINSIHDIFIDDEQRVWVSTFRKGVNLLDPNVKPFNVIRHELNSKKSLHNNVVRSICEVDRGEFLFGTEKGISSYNSKTNRWELMSYLQNEAILGIVIWNENIVASTFGKGLIFIDAATGRIKEQFFKNEDVDDFVYVSYVDRENNLWFTSLDWLHRLDSDMRITKYPVKGVKDIIQTRDGRILVGSFGGIYQINDDNSVLSYPKNSDDDILKSELVWSIFEDGDTLWVGTEGGGLNAIDMQTGIISHIESVTSSMIYDIGKDNNNIIWMLTSKGLAQYNSKSEIFTNYTTEDNLPTNDYLLGKIIKSQEGNFYVTSSYGVVEFNPQQIRKYQTPSDIFITKFTVSGDDYFSEESLFSPLYLKHIKLKHNQNNLSFKFEAVGFTNIGKNSYKWKLEGYDTDWTISSSRVAYYSNLFPGEYTLKYLVSNCDGVWMETSKSLSIIITPAVWATIWAKIVYALIVIALFAFTFYLYHLKVTSKHMDDKIRSFINIAHDINNMVSVIKLSADKMTQGVQTKSSKLLFQNSERLSAWVSQLIVFQKAERGSLKLRISETEILPFITDILYSFSPLMEQKKLKVSVDIDSNINLWFDRILMERVFINIISNAVKFSNEGGMITAFGKNSSDGFTVSIKDYGIGIPKKDQKEVFKRFYRADNSNAEKQNIGSGVGLMLSKHIVKHHYGKIDFSSSSGDGATFNIYLKKGYDHFSKDQLKDERQDEIIAEKDIDLSGFGKKRILLIDDNDEFRGSLKDDLSETFIIIEARNGEEGLVKASEIMPDLIITDIMMPKISGSELCYRLKNDEATNHIPIIILTSLATTHDKIENLEYGADAYIEKPLNIKLLKITLQNIFHVHERLKKLHNISSDDTRQTSPKRLSTNNTFLRRITDLIKLQLQNKKPVDIDEICDKMGLSRSVYYRKVKTITNLSPATFSQKVKLFYAAELLTDSQHLSIKEVAFNCGFVNSKHFCVAFKKEFDITPSNYRDEQKPSQPSSS